VARGVITRTVEIRPVSPGWKSLHQVPIKNDRKLSRITMRKEKKRGPVESPSSNDLSRKNKQQKRTNGGRRMEKEKLWSRKPSHLIIGGEEKKASKSKATVCTKMRKKANINNSRTGRATPAWGDAFKKGQGYNNTVGKQVPPQGSTSGRGRE